MFTSGGMYPAEIENTSRLIRFRMGGQGEPYDTRGECGHAFVILRPSSCLTKADVLAYCEGALARYKWPVRISFRQAFPRTSLGKVRKAELK